MAEKLYRFYWDGYRGNDVHGLFIADEAEVTRFLDSDVYFGEINGKHSEVYGTLELSDLEILIEDESIIEALKVANKGKLTLSGHNPIEVLQEQEREEEQERRWAEENPED